MITAAEWAAIKWKPMDVRLYIDYDEQELREIAALRVLKLRDFLNYEPENVGAISSHIWSIMDIDYEMILRTNGLRQLDSMSLLFQ